MKKSEEIKTLFEIEMLMLGVKNLFNRISAKMSKSSVGIMGFPINPSQLKAMAAFIDDRPLSMTELCKIADVKMPSMTEAVDRFEKEGIIKRTRDKTDRRVVKVCLTEKGKMAHHQILEKRSNDLENLFGNLGQEEKSLLVNSLNNTEKILNKLL